MLTIQTDLRECLVILREAHRALKSNPCSETHQPFYHALKQATELFGNDEHPVIAKAIACYWLDHFSSTLVNAINHFPYREDIDLFVSLVVRNKIVQELTVNKRAEKVLACVCISRVLLYSEGHAHQAHPHPEHNNISNLLEQWFAAAVPSEALESVPVLADLLYGTGVWALYGGDVAWPEDSPSYLYNLNLSVVHKDLPPAVISGATRALPDDISP